MFEQFDCQQTYAETNHSCQCSNVQKNVNKQISMSTKFKHQWLSWPKLKDDASPQDVDSR